MFERQGLWLSQRPVHQLYHVPIGILIQRSSSRQEKSVPLIDVKSDKRLTAPTCLGLEALWLVYDRPGPFGKPPQWGAADAEIKVPSGENAELKCSPFKAWSR